MIFLWVIAAFAFLLRITYGVLSPYRDSGDLVAAASSLGIAHPPGYATYMLLAKIGLFLFPFGNLAYRANFLSALWTSLACAVLYKIFSLKSGRPSALIAVALWLLSPAVIQLSIVSEMYSLNSLFCAAILLCVSLSAGKEPRYLLLAAFLIGLGFHNHPTIVFLLPGFFCYWFFSDSGADWRTRAAELGWFAFFGALGFSLAAYYPIRSFREPVIDWGNPETFRNFWRLITRADYGGLKLHPEQSQLSWTGEAVWIQLKLFGKAQWQELHAWGNGLMLLGLISSLRNFKKDRATALFYGVSYLVTGPLFFVLSNMPVREKTTLPILQPYLVMSGIFAAFWTAEGWNWAGDQIRRFLPARAPRFAPLALVLAFAGFKSWPESRRGEFYTYDFGKNVLKTLPLNASLYDPDDVTAFTISYLQIAERARPDVVMLMTLKTFWGYDQMRLRHANVMPPGAFTNARDFIAALLPHQIQIGRALFSDHASKIPSNLPSFPVGLLTQVENVPEPKAFEARQEIFHFYVERGGSHGPIVDFYPDFFTRHLLSLMSAALCNVGVWEQNAGNLVQAEIYFRRALAREKSLTAAWNNLGLNYFIQGDFSMADSVLAEGFKKSENPESLYLALGLSQRRAKKYREAIVSLTEVLKRAPAHLTAMNEMGLVAMDTENWSDAKAWFERCLQTAPNDATAHYNLGLVQKMTAEKAEAARHFAEYLRLSPGARDARQVERWINQLKG